MDLPEENPAIRELLHQLATDLRGLADGLMRVPPGSREWLEQVMGGLVDVGEDFEILKSEVAKGLVIKRWHHLRGYNDRRGLALWMLTGTLQTAGDAHQNVPWPWSN